jgi:type IV secretory pathway TrbL component
VEDESQRQKYSISRYRGAMRWAMAASVLLAIGVIGVMMRHQQVPPNPVAAAPAVLDVSGPQAEVAIGAAQADVSVGQPQEADAAAAYTADSVVVQRPVIALDGFPSVGHLQ